MSIRKVSLFAAIAIIAVTAAAFGQSAPAIQVKIWNAHLKSGDSYPFQNMTVGENEDPETVEITNVGKSNLEFTGSDPVTVSGPNASMFMVLGQPAGPVAPGQTAYFNLKYRPTLAGVNNATVTIASNDPTTPSFSFNVQASAFGRRLRDIFLLM